MSLWNTAKKAYFFLSVLLFFAHYSTGWNEAIIVELKALFVLNGTFITFSGGFPSLDLSQLRKTMPALAFNFLIAATYAWRGKWNRHAVALFDNFFYTGAIFLIFVKKCKKWKCPLPYEEVLEAIIKAILQNSVEISNDWDTRGSFIAIWMKINWNIFSFMTPSWT